MKLKDKVVLITASTRGIGLACVKECAKEGATVYMAARNLELAKKEADKLTAQGYNVKYVYNDASKPESFMALTTASLSKSYCGSASSLQEAWTVSSLLSFVFLLKLPKRAPCAIC